MGPSAECEKDRHRTPFCEPAGVCPVTDEKPVAASKASKKVEQPEPENVAPVLTFDDYVVTDGLSAVRAGSLEYQLRATTGLAPRPLLEWRAATNHYQAQS